MFGEHSCKQKSETWPQKFGSLDLCTGISCQRGRRTHSDNRPPKTTFRLGHPRTSLHLADAIDCPRSFVLQSNIKTLRHTTKMNLVWVCSNASPSMNPAPSEKNWKRPLSKLQADQITTNMKQTTNTNRTQTHGSPYPNNKWTKQNNNLNLETTRTHTHIRAWNHMNKTWRVYRQHWTSEQHWNTLKSLQQSCRMKIH